MLDHEHPQTTRRSHYRYMFTHKHHSGDGDGQWNGSLTEDDEFDVFDGADEMEISDERGNLYGALREGLDSLRNLGTYDEQIAKFWKQPEGMPWHGFPVWSINQEGPENRRRNPPPKVVFNKMVEVGLLRRAKANRLRGGHHI